MVTWAPHADPRLAGYNIPGLDFRERDAAWKRMHADPSIRHVAGVIGTVCRAHVVLRLRPERVASVGIAMDAAFVGRGYGRRILRELVRYCTEVEALASLVLEVHLWNERAIRAYLAAGFVAGARTDDVLSMEATCAS